MSSFLDVASPANSAEQDEPIEGLVYGLHALLAEMASQGVSAPLLLKGSALRAEQLDDPQVLITRQQRLVIFGNAYRLSKRADVGLLAGRRQRVSDYGIFGYALASCRTMGDALDLTTRYLRQAGPVLRISSRFEGDIRIYRSHDPESVGHLVPFVAEFWRSSVQTLFSRTLGAPFPSVRMLFPYKAPPHWRSYARQFRCPIEFDAEVMEWHMDTRFDSMELPNANPVTAAACQWICEQIFEDQPRGSELKREIQRALVSSPKRFADLGEVAEKMCMSRSTLHRRLKDEGLSFQGISDEVRKSLALRYLRSTPFDMEQIAEQVGFTDVANFRRAFKRWVGLTPSEVRGANGLALSNQSENRARGRSPGMR